MSRSVAPPGFTVPDLLYSRPSENERVSARGLTEALTFAFARGVDQERLLALLQPKVGSTTFEKSSFADDLFLKELIDSSFSLVIAGTRLDAPIQYFREILVAPPRDLEDIRYRQNIVSELGQDKDRRSLVESAYLCLRDFREMLCGSHQFNQRSVGLRRRIDILIAFRRALDALLAATGGSTSGLSKLADWVEQVRQQETYVSLINLLDFEDGRTVLQTRLQASYDGTLRRFEIVGVSTVEHRAFPRGAVSRFFRSLISLFKGYRFSEEDVMSHVLDQVFTDLEAEVVTVLRFSLQLEFYLRACHFADCAKESGLQTCLPRFDTDGEEQEVELVGLYNPWLAAQKVTNVVPCDIRLTSRQRITIVTGPNSGGKTRLMQSLAIAQLLAQVGLPVPARSAKLRPVEQLFLSLIEHMEPDQDEGRLGLELKRIRRAFENSGKNALIVMDELCSGTNPSEGEGIFEMVLELLLDLGPQVWITTHFLDFAERIREKSVHGKMGKSDQEIVFLKVDLDAQERPTYQFVPGVAETSLARNTASRLGVTREELRALIQRRTLAGSR